MPALAWPARREPRPRMSSGLASAGAASPSTIATTPRDCRREFTRFVAYPRTGSRMTTTFACQNCGAGLTFDGVRTATCPYCASPNFVERPPAQGQPDPQFVVTFVGDGQVA